MAARFSLWVSRMAFINAMSGTAPVSRKHVPRLFPLACWPPPRLLLGLNSGVISACGSRSATGDASSTSSCCRPRSSLIWADRASQDESWRILALTQTSTCRPLQMSRLTAVSTVIILSILSGLAPEFRVWGSPGLILWPRRLCLVYAGVRASTTTWLSLSAGQYQLARLSSSALQRTTS